MSLTVNLLFEFELPPLQLHRNLIMKVVPHQDRLLAEFELLLILVD